MYSHVGIKRLCIKSLAKQHVLEFYCNDCTTFAEIIEFHALDVVV